MILNHVFSTEKFKDRKKIYFLANYKLILPSSESIVFSTEKKGKKNTNEKQNLAKYLTKD